MACNSSLNFERETKMKTLHLLSVALLLCASAFAWDCTTPGQIRVQVPTGTKGNGQGDDSGHVDTVEGITFQCQTPPAASKSHNNVATNTNTNTNNNSNQNTNNNTATSTASSNQTQAQKQQQSQTATGGTASSTSNATGGNATANGDNSNNSTTNYDAARIPVNTAITPPILPTAPCLKGYGGAGQGATLGLSGGFSRVDGGCDDRELARSFEGPQTVASCKILINTKKAKKAGVTMEDCMSGVRRQQTIIVQAPPAPVPTPAPIVIPAPQVSVTVTPAPVVTLPAPPQYRTSITVHAPVKHTKPECQNQLVMRCVAKSQEK